MVKLFRRLLAISIIIFFTAQTAWAAGAQGAISRIRFSQTAEKVRIVLDMNIRPEFKADYDSQSMLLTVDVPAENKSKMTKVTFNDPVVQSYQIVETESGKQRVIIRLKAQTIYRIFPLKNPNRLVIDVIKNYRQKVVSKLAYGITYTSWIDGLAAGPVAAHILDIDLNSSGYEIKPVLAKGRVSGVEPLSAIADRHQALAAINASFFEKSGSILGLLKIEGELISVANLARTAIGMRPDGAIFMQQVHYRGKIQLPQGGFTFIDGINTERGADSIVLYNYHYGDSTATNNFGREYVIKEDTITAVYDHQGNNPIPPGSVILSAHGRAIQNLGNLRIGDKVQITHDLGKEWNDTLFAVGAGPMLVHRGNVFLTTKVEEFGSDVAGGRAPRSAIGITKDKHLLLVVIDGRSNESVGMNLLELGLFMQQLGAVEAMNLDGGGSSEMIVKGKIVNNPSDKKERNIGNAFVVVPRPLAK